MNAPHVTRYLERLDAHLAALKLEDRRSLLETQRESWLRAMTAFAERVDAGLPTDPRVHYADYLVTIAEIDFRLEHLNSPTPEENAI